jgi:hypothetical protein
MLIGVTIFGNPSASGMRFQHVGMGNGESFRRLEGYIGLPSTDLSLPNHADVDLFLLRGIGSETSDQRLLWVGLYRPLPDGVRRRTGENYGIGIWIAEGSIDATMTVAWLRARAREIEAGIKRHLGAWTPDSHVVTRDQIVEWARAFSDARSPGDGVAARVAGGKTLFLHVGEAEIPSVVQAAIDREPFRYFDRVMVSSSHEIVGSIRSSAIRIETAVESVRSPPRPTAQPMTSAVSWAQAMAPRADDRVQRLPVQREEDDMNRLSDLVHDLRADLHAFQHRLDQKLKAPQTGTARPAWRSPMVIATSVMALMWLSTTIAFILLLARAPSEERLQAMLIQRDTVLTEPLAAQIRDALIPNALIIGDRQAYEAGLDQAMVAVDRYIRDLPRGGLSDTRREAAQAIGTLIGRQRSQWPPPTIRPAQ